MPRPSRVITHLSDEELTARDPVLPRVATMLRPYRSQIALVMVAVVTSAALTSLMPFLIRRSSTTRCSRRRRPARPRPARLAGRRHVRHPDRDRAHRHRPELADRPRSATPPWPTSAATCSRTCRRWSWRSSPPPRPAPSSRRLANDVAGVRTVLTDTATSILQNSVTVTAALISMVVLSWQLTILTLILMPLFVVVQLRVGRRRQRLAQRDPGVAVGDDRDHRGGAQRLRHPARRRSSTAPTQRSSATARPTASRPGCRSSRR